MPVDDSKHVSPVPRRIPEKLKTIRQRLGLTRDAIAEKVGARTGAEIRAYEEDEDDLLVSVLYGYANLAGCPIDNLLSDDLEV
jgi:transcriptional regulator with XRE-family HTH domain